MTSSKNLSKATRAEEVAARLSNALQQLKSNHHEISLDRARAIYATASRLIDTVKIEAVQSATNQEKK